MFQKYQLVYQSNRIHKFTATKWHIQLPPNSKQHVAISLSLGFRMLQFPFKDLAYHHLDLPQLLHIQIDQQLQGSWKSSTSHPGSIGWWVSRGPPLQLIASIGRTCSEGCAPKPNLQQQQKQINCWLASLNKEWMVLLLVKVRNNFLWLIPSLCIFCISLHNSWLTTEKNAQICFLGN